MTPSKRWLCDFLAFLNNGAKLRLEIDNLPEKSKRKERLEEKINYYNNINCLYHKITSDINLENIIDRYSSWYKIPIDNSIITSHKDPDGDALSSMVTVYNYLISNGKKAIIRPCGTIPKNLEWILDGAEVSKKIPEWCERVIVLDCAPHKDRLGWKIPEELPIYNIDHHVQRIDENDPDNGIHVIKSCSTSSILFSRFGFKDDILIVGIYTDTFFTKYLSEVLYTLDEFNADEDLISSYISKINSNPDKKIWDILQNSDTHKCRNGFIIVETDVSGADVIESVMQILSKLSESVCLIYGKDNTVKLRTSNPNLDLSKIAQKYSGGGHKYASGCVIKGSINEFKSDIISCDVPKIEMDGYQ